MAGEGWPGSAGVLMKLRHTVRSVATANQSGTSRRFSRVTSRHRRRGPHAGREVRRWLNRSCLGTRSGSRRATWPSHSSLRCRTLSDMAMASPQRSRSWAEEICSSHCRVRETPRMARRQRWWNLSSRARSALRGVQHSDPYNKVVVTHAVYRCLLVERDKAGSWKTLRRAPNAFAALAIRRATSSAERESGVMTLPR